MRILIVCSGNKINFHFEKHRPFIFDQVNAIRKHKPEIEYDFFFIKGKGILGYLRNHHRFLEYLLAHKFDLIHAHFAYSGLFANLQRKIPVICTFHGSDINVVKNRIISILVVLLSRANIYVSRELLNLSLHKRNSYVIPCGVDMNLFNYTSRIETRRLLKLDANKNYILFSSSFNNKIKNFKLLQEALKLINETSTEIIELKNYSRKEVSLLMNAVNICVMTSLSEGSPQFIKEAMACGCPIVTTKVGDVENTLGFVEGCYICKMNPEDVAEKIDTALHFSKMKLRTLGRERILDLSLDSGSIANRIVQIYESSIPIS